MLHIISHQGNVNQSSSKIYFIPTGMAISPRTQISPSVGKEVKKLESGCKIVQSLWKAA
jgi:hypothetical protein